MREPRFHRMTAYDHARLPNPVLARLDRGAEGPDQWAATSGYSIGHPGWGLLYHVVLCAVTGGRANDIIETGTNQGASTIVLAQALRDADVEGIVRTVEIQPDNVEIARRNVAEAGLAERIEFHTGSSHDCLPEMLKRSREVALAFLDGSHLEADVLREFELVHPTLNRTAVVVFDNTYRIAEQGEDGRVNAALRTIVERWGGHLVNLPFCSWYTPGIALWQRDPFETMEPSVMPDA